MRSFDDETVINATYELPCNHKNATICSDIFKQINLNSL